MGGGELPYLRPALSLILVSMDSSEHCASPLWGLVMLVSGMQGNGAPLIPSLPSKQVPLAL